MTPPIFAHGHLRLYLLSLLADDPMHGYELMLALEERFGGTYTPSAGTIYPRLAKLEEEGLVTKAPDGRKTVYSITDAGRAELAAREHELDDIENDVSDSVRRLADEVRLNVNRAMKSLRADLAAAAREARDEAKGAAREAKGAAKEFRDEARGAARTMKDELRDDLRSEFTRGSRSDTRSNIRETSSSPLREGEAIVNEFRHQLRVDLRSMAARNELTNATITELKTKLDEVRASFGAKG